jgi:hypothetical protein
MIVRADHFAFEAQFSDKRERFWFSGNEAVGTAIEQAILPAAGLDDAAESRRFLKDGALDPRAMEIVRRR